MMSALGFFGVLLLLLSGCTNTAVKQSYMPDTSNSSYYYSEDSNIISSEETIITSTAETTAVLTDEENIEEEKKTVLCHVSHFIGGANEENPNFWIGEYYTVYTDGTMDYLSRYGAGKIEKECTFTLTESEIEYITSYVPTEERDPFEICDGIQWNVIRYNEAGEWTNFYGKDEDAIIDVVKKYASHKDIPSY